MIQQYELLKGDVDINGVRRSCQLTLGAVRGTTYGQHLFKSSGGLPVPDLRKRRTVAENGVLATTSTPVCLGADN